MKNITIIGSGSFGCALSYILSKNNHNIKIWSYTKEETNLINNEHKCKFLDNLILTDSIKCYTSYEEAINESEYIILVVPRNAIIQTCINIKPFIKNQTIILATKGLSGKDYLLSDVIKDELNKDVSIISGPSHAEQIIKDIPTYINYYGKENIKELFETDNFHLIYNNDYIGMQIGAALKNVIAIICGIAEGLNYETNTMSYLITKGLKEIKNIGIKMGAKEETFYDLCSLGDLLTTTLSLDSRNKRFGLLLSKGKNIDEIQKEIGMTIEGLDALNNAHYLIDKYNLDCPLITNLYEIIYNNKDIHSII
ncbi:MAG: NAD(P)H-dependent glycerol-3-phosphate dehydrogenase [Bacilli bacterium]|nr:NAD(P)H-dependent glycerol-3-phosphate dehydrogenase [Bacilli bacterium]